GHMTADSIIALRALIKFKGDVEKASEIIAEVKKNEWLDPEIAAVALNTIARKTEQVRRGPVTRTMILGTEGVRSAAVFRRAQKTYEGLKAGKSVDEIVMELDRERQTTVETRAASMLGAMTGHEVKIEIKKLVGGARRDHPFTNSYYGFDTDADVDLTVDGTTFELRGLGQNVIPDAVFNDKKDLLEIIPLAAIPICELQLSGHSIINITVPAAVAAAMKVLEPKEAAKLAEKGAKAGTAAIPGGREKALAVAKLALRIMSSMEAA
ncbi:MAG: hypothetical protein PHV51_10495, partial [Methanosarcinaceae archaeon]|nr:hypothetical protein [Methanosarcinaceae archaeon]